MPTNWRRIQTQENVSYSVKLHSTHDFVWEREIWGEQPSKEGEESPTGYGDDNAYYVWVKYLDHDYDLNGENQMKLAKEAKLQE